MLASSGCRNALSGFEIQIASYHKPLFRLISTLEKMNIERLPIRTPHWHPLDIWLDH